MQMLILLVDGDLSAAEKMIAMIGALLAEEKEEYLIVAWLGKKSIEEERTAAISLARKIVESMKSQAVLARFYEGKEPIQFFCIFQRFQVFKGGLSSGYKTFLKENSLVDDTYSEEGIAVFRVQGSGPS